MGILEIRSLLEQANEEDKEFFKYYFSDCTKGWDDEFIEKYKYEVESDFERFLVIAKLKEKWKLERAITS